MTNALSALSRPDTVLRLPEVRRVTGLNRSSIYALESNNHFPQRLKLGARSVGWLESEIRNWFAARAEQRRPSTPASAPLPSKIQVIRPMINNGASEVGAEKQRHTPGGIFWGHHLDRKVEPGAYSITWVDKSRPRFRFPAEVAIVASLRLKRNLQVAARMQRQSQQSPAVRRGFLTDVLTRSVVDLPIAPLDHVHGEHQPTAG